jgi:hypothetical protein
VKRDSDRATEIPAIDLGEFAAKHASRSPFPADLRLAPMRSAAARGRYDDAIRLAHEMLRDRPQDVECLMTVDECRKALEELHIFSSSSRFRVPQLVKPINEVMALPLDHRAGFVLSLIDGMCNVDQIASMCPMPNHETVEVLFGLLRLEAIAMR